MTKTRHHDPKETPASEISAYGFLDNLIEGCQIISRDWRYLYVNDTAVRQARTPREQLLGHTMMECFPGINLTPMFATLRKCMEQRVSGTLENEFTFPNGLRGWFELHFEPVPEGAYILSLERDQHRYTDKEIRQFRKLETVGQVAGGVAHDFNNLLTVILIYAKLLETQASTDPARLAVEQIRRAGENATALTGQLLAFGREHLSKARLIDINSVVVGAEKMLRSLVGEDITLVSKLEDGLGSVKATPGQIEQILVNLAVNARDAMPLGGEILLETRRIMLTSGSTQSCMGVRTGPHIMLAVSDTGIGMNKATQSRIFEPFFTTKAPGKGTGLGLATVFDIVKKNGGFIRVISEPRQGSMFEIYLPCPKERTSSTRRQAKRLEAPHGTETVVLVENNEDVRAVTASALKVLGYNVLQAEHGNEAMEICKRYDGPIHLLVSDVVMPGMDGPRTAVALQSLRPDIKVMFLSGYPEATLVRHGIRDNEPAFLKKPFTMDSLAQKVRETLTRA